MSKKTYPVIGASRKRPGPPKAKCLCGQPAHYRVDIEVNIFRGDDEVVWSCESHRHDAHFLLGLNKQPGESA
jgi:hypothetical protein